MILASRGTSGRLTALTGVVFALVAVRAGAVPIPGPLDGPLPRYTGAATRAEPLRGPFRPQNPALAGDGRSGTGLAAGNGASSPFSGPLGVRTTRSSALIMGTCSAIAFDARDRLLTGCNGPTGPALHLLDPTSLASRGTMMLPARRGVDRTDLGGGTHFIVREDGTLLVPTTGTTILHVGVQDAGFKVLSTIDLAGLLSSGEHPFAVGAGYDGRDWVVGSAGTVVALPRDGGKPQGLHLDEPVAEDLATDPSGTYVVTQSALYRLGVAGDGVPRVRWRLPLGTPTADPRAGRVHLGPGSPPVMVGGGYVATTDGVNPTHVVVARVGGRDSRRLRCSVPVFVPGLSSVEAHLVVNGRSIVVANAYGYSGLGTTEGGGTTTGGITRISVGARGCRVVWSSALVSPSANAVVSRRTGLLYTVVKPSGRPDGWYLAAVDWRTGALRFTALAGEGLGFNSDGGPVVLGPDGAAYAGSFGGISRFKDASP